MADQSIPSEDTSITFNVKASEAKYVLTLPLSTSILALKEKLSGEEYSKIPAHRQRLIYSGRVLKDGDSLASYKVKQGNTVHLVKSAESNAAQAPAGSSTAGTSPAVPQMAAGTGRDPLAGLTGARYAGFAQMPNANMFGPDGGMGPPPDPEHMASLLENPNFASTLNEALSNPTVVEQMIRSNPMFQGAMGAQARLMLQDPNFRRMMTDPATLRQMNEMRRTMPGMFGRQPGAEAFPMPGSTDTNNNSRDGQQDQRDETAAANPPSNPPSNPFAIFGLAGPGPTGAQTATNTPTSPANPGQSPPTPGNPASSMVQQLMQNPQMMQQMMASMGGGGGGAGAGPMNPTTEAGFNPFAALQAMQGNGGFGPMGGGQQAPQDTRPPEDRYAEQLRQLNDMGFYEFERNVEALRRTGGSVQGAVEYLLTH